MEERDIASFFVEDLGLALAPKFCPHRSQALKYVNNRQAFTSRFQVLQGMFLQSFAQIFEELTA